MTLRLFLAMLLFAATAGAAPLPVLPALPANSLYHLPVTLTDQDGRVSTLAEHRGQPLLITMFFANCEFVCPRLLDSLKQTRAAIPAADRARLPALAVSFDPARDDVATLKRVAGDHGVDFADFRLARVDDREARKLAAALGIQYRALPGGDFNHTSVLILLDAEGRIAGRTGDIGGTDPAFVAKARKTLGLRAKP